MFCKKCGTQLPDGSAFCQKCGTPQSDAPAPVQQAAPAPSVNQAERNMLVTQMTRSNQVMRDIIAVEQEINKLDQDRQYHEKKSKSYGLTLGLMVAAVPVGMIVGALIGSIIASVIASATGNKEVITTMGTPSILLGILVFEVLAIVLTTMLRMKHKKQADDLRAAAQAQYQILKQHQSNPLLSWLPPAYRYGHAMSTIVEYVRNMRANTLQEALNLYETEMHQARVELNSAIAAMAAQDAAASASTAAGAAAAGAVINLLK